jgi:hypothetical protein
VTGVVPNVPLLTKVVVLAVSIEEFRSTVVDVLLIGSGGNAAVGTESDCGGERIAGNT